MKQEISLSPEELFFLGRQMKAPYIDYAYIAAMEDVQKSFSSSEQKYLYSLQQKGVLTEDFFGDVTLTEQSYCFRPLFFGSQEGRLEICGPCGDVKLLDMRFHFMDGELVISSLSGKQIQFWSAKVEELEAIIKGILNLSEWPMDVSEFEATITEKDASGVYVATFGEADGFSDAKIWFEKDSVLYEKTDSNKAKSVTVENMLSKISELFKGGKFNGKQ